MEAGDALDGGWPWKSDKRLWFGRDYEKRERTARKLKSVLRRVVEKLGFEKGDKMCSLRDS